LPANSRIDELTKRLEKEPGSRLFAQLAEELRKEGELAQAIRICREGLLRHPAYPSARMTLGRALLDTGAWAEARAEFESVLKAAPDNILASRFLAECHEGLGDLDRAEEQYQATLRYAPGDKQIAARLDAIREARQSAALVAPTVMMRPSVPASISAAEPLPSTILMPPPARPSSSAPAPPPPAPEPPPIPLVEADEEFELERPYDSMARTISTPPSPTVTEQTLPRMRAPEIPSAPPEVTSRFTALDDEAASAPVEEARPGLDTLFRFSAFEEPAPVVAEPEREPEVTPEPPAVEVAAPPLEITPEPEPVSLAPAPAPTPDPELVSPTLAELYFSQGHVDKAIEVYRQLLRGGPDNEKSRMRLLELEEMERRHRPAAPVDLSNEERRAAIVRTIERLERLLAVIRSH
jgi:tetratricopeptide (TPR) repeat protein